MILRTRYFCDKGLEVRNERFKLEAMDPRIGFVNETENPASR